MTAAAHPKTRTERAAPVTVSSEILSGYPTMREAARMLRVSPSTLSRAKDLVTYPRADELRVPAREVMRLAAYHNKRPIYEVGGDLIDRALRTSDVVAEAVEREIQPALNATPSLELTVQDFLAEAERGLPRALFEQVRNAYERRRRPPSR